MNLEKVVKSRKIQVQTPTIVGQEDIDQINDRIDEIEAGGLQDKITLNILAQNTKKRVKNSSMINEYKDRQLATFSHSRKSDQSSGKNISFKNDYTSAIEVNA